VLERAPFTSTTWVWPLGWPLLVRGSRPFVVELCNIGNDPAVLVAAVVLHSDEAVDELVDRLDELERLRVSLGAGPSDPSKLS